MFNEEDYLQLSGIQHFKFCRRQWALIHIEQQWRENFLTVSGGEMHERAHNEKLTERRGDLLIMRAMPVFSATLGCAGVCDIVEFRLDDNGITIFGKYSANGERFSCTPVEYKRGKVKKDTCDELQLCAQAICLEQMLVTEIPYGYLFYGETQSRHEVEFTKELRGEVTAMFAEMHKYHMQGYTPKVKTGKFCFSCSMKDVCLPQICGKLSAADYINKYLENVQTGK
jgi:CRISPR-associated exonuclease Cas4